MESRAGDTQREAVDFFRTSRQQNPIGLALFSFVARDLLRLTETLQKAGSLLAELADGDGYEQRGFRYMSNQLISPGRHLFKETETSDEGSNEQLGRRAMDPKRNSNQIKSCVRAYQTNCNMLKSHVASSRA